MNIELIVKLVKLANNNPNENEANLAARKVCSLIAAGDYKFAQTKTAQAKVHVKSNPTANDWVKYHDKPKQRDWKDISVDFDIENFYDAVFGRNNGPFNRSNKNQDPIFDEGREKASKKGKPKVELECIKCQRKVNTAFVGPPQTFVCTICIWEAYMKDKK